jgi:hypothetical protein
VSFRTTVKGGFVGFWMDGYLAGIVGSLRLTMVGSTAVSRRMPSLPVQQVFWPT